MFNTYPIAGESSDSVAANTTASLYMPATVAISTNSVYIGGGKDAGQAPFWTDIDISHTPNGYESVRLAAAANTDEQTIVDTTGEGVLTSVIAPSPSASGVMTIRVTADGRTTTFTSATHSANDRFIVGNFKGWRAVTGASTTASLGGASDFGYAVQSSYYMPTPPVSIMDAPIGIKFLKSLKVTIQCSVNVTATANLLNCCACYTTSIPEGL